MANCTGNWKPFDDHCYLFVEDQDKKWIAAEAHCVGEKGHLASITSVSIRDYVKSNYETNAPRWMGAKRLKMEVSWTWVDGSPWEYEDWDWSGPSGEDKAGGNCAWLSKSDGFKHRSCDDTALFICSNKLCQPQTTTTGKILFIL